MTTFVNAGGPDDGIQGTTASHDKNGISGLNDDTTPRNALTPEGNGVFGSTQVPDGAGVFGLHNSGGVGVSGFGHPAGIGVVGVSAPAGAKGGDGVFGVSNSEHRNGVIGRNDSTTARADTNPGGNGVFGFTQVPDGAGVFGAHASTGVGVAGLGQIGVSGGSANGVGVMGVSAPPGAKGGDGVQGITNSEFRNGVFGRNDSTTARNNGDPAGNGVFGFSQVPDGAGALGAHGAGGHGVIGTGGFGITGIGTVMGVWGQAKGAGWAGFFTGPIRVDGSVQITGSQTVDGDLEITGNHTIGGDLSLKGNVQGSMSVNGNVSVTGDVFLANGGDLAETFDVAPNAEWQPGTVMVLGDTGSLEPCARGYDRRTIGVVTGAGGSRPAVTFGARRAPGTGVPIALVGTTCCLADADLGAIEAGDLMTTSETAGHAKKAADPSRRIGTIIGKALASLDSGRGLVPILIMLQ